MPAANTVPNEDRYKKYEPTSPTTDFPVSFGLWSGSLADAAADLEVRIDGVPRNSGDAVMSELALIKGDEIVQVFQSWASRVDLPGVGQVSPPRDGWSGHGFRIAAVVMFEWPEGQVVVGPPTYSLVDGVPVQHCETEPAIKDLAAYAADLRWQKETGGTVWNGWPVHTDRESQNKVLAERMAIELGQRVDPDGWKFADGEFRMVSNAEFIALTDAVRAHVRQSFATEAAVLAEIEAGLITTAAEVEAEFS